MKKETLFGFKHLSTQKSLSLISGTLTPNCYTTKSSSPPPPQEFIYTSP
jgi:hypothetical protein